MYMYNIVITSNLNRTKLINTFLRMYKTEHAKIILGALR